MVLNIDYQHFYIFFFVYSQFGFFDANETVVLIKDQGFYKNDSFGLKSLDKEGKLKIIELSGNTHLQWHINMTVIDNYILPYLD